jgi:NAD-dependent dihydropyrimidine dehydrogenase PreA subunit
VALDVARTALREPVGAETEAFDVARMAVRMGAREVSVVALESRAEMPAHEYEIAEAEEEGIRILHRLGPHRILGEHHVEGLETVRVSSVFDANGRFNPVFVDDSEASMACESVILAIGQAPDLSWVDPSDGLEVSPRGTIAVDRPTLATSRPDVFAGGDAAFGPRNLIDAIADGRRAAASIHKLIAGDEPADVGPRPSMVRRLLPVATVHRPLHDSDSVPRVPIPSEASERRIGMPEVELGYTEEQARREAARCLQCFLNIELDTSLCILCGGCVDICPEHCIRIVPAEAVAGAPEPASLPAADAPAAAAPYGTASTLVIQEDFCIRCGLCIDRCPTHALSFEGWTETSTAPVALGAV